MKPIYVLLKKEYSQESLYDLSRDVAECEEFPNDKEYLQIKNTNADYCGFLAGKYKVTIEYYPDTENGDKLVQE